MRGSDQQVNAGYGTSATERAEGLIHALRITVGPHFTEKAERIVHHFLDDMSSPAEVERLRAEHGSMNRACDHLEEVGMAREEENRALTEEVERLRDGISALLAEKPRTIEDGVTAAVPWRRRLSDLLDLNTTTETTP